MIKIYGKPTCVWCEKAKKVAEQYNLKYEYKDIEYTKNFEELKTLLPDVKQIPQIWWDGRYIGGYNEFTSEITNTISGYGEGTI